MTQFRICSLEMAWIWRILSLFMINLLAYTLYVPMKCNRVTLTLANVTKENEKAIIWLEECLFFLFSIVQHDIQ